MLMTILGWVFLGLAVWLVVALLVALVVGKGIRIADRRTELPEDTRVRVRGRRLHIVTHVD
jgi:hypothetical protein